MKENINGQFLKIDDVSIQSDWEKLEKRMETMEPENNIQPKLRIVKYKPKPSALEQLKVIVRKIKRKLNFRKKWKEKA